MNPHVVVAGLAVVDIIGKPVNLRRPPKKGGLQQIDLLTVTTGGNVSNVGIDLVKLGFRVAAITRVGNDSLGRFLLQEFEEHGLETSGVFVDQDAQTSATFVSVDGAGERTFFHTRGCMARFRARDVLAHMRLVGGAEWFVFGYLGLLPEIHKDLPSLFRTIRKRTGCRILLDTGGVPPRMNRRALAELLSSVDCFVPSFEEAVRLTGEKTAETIIRAFRAAGARGIVGVKLGAKGCYVAEEDRGMYIPARRVRSVVDTTGAGDAFVAGFVGSLIKGRDAFDAARIANAVAASCVTAVGASTAIRKFETYLP
ncbi:MAG: carbohydrate kinase family protein [Ignavibacteriales bacterium]|nr:carbohydrate kinase family protein [Ignavibacteriales bacterium]